MLNLFSNLYVNWGTLLFRGEAIWHERVKNNLGNEVFIFIALFITLGFIDFIVGIIYKKYKKITNSANYTGESLAKDLLERNKLYNIKIVEMKITKKTADKVGERIYLMDHYDSRLKVIALTETIFNSNFISDIIISAHQVTYAILYSKRSILVKLRTFLSVTTMIISFLGIALFMIGFVSTLFIPMQFIFEIIRIGLTLFIIGIILGILNVPVEFYLSKKTLSLLKENNILQEDEVKIAKKMLNNISIDWLTLGGGELFTGKKLKIYCNKDKSNI